MQAHTGPTDMQLGGDVAVMGRKRNSAPRAVRGSVPCSRASQPCPGGPYCGTFWI